jgi:hypothetical protein
MVERRRPAGSSPIVLSPQVEPEPVQTPTTAVEAVQASEPAVHSEAAPATVTKIKREPRPVATPAAVALHAPVSDAKVQRTFQFKDSLIKRAETAVLRTAGQGGHTSMTALLNAALERELQRLETEFNDGEPFPANCGAFRAAARSAADGAGQPPIGRGA